MGLLYYALAASEGSAREFFDEPESFIYADIPGFDEFRLIALLGLLSGGKIPKRWPSASARDKLGFKTLLTSKSESYVFSLPHSLVSSLAARQEKTLSKIVDEWVETESFTASLAPGLTRTEIDKSSKRAILASLKRLRRECKKAVARQTSVLCQISL